MTKIVVVKQEEPEESVVHQIGNWYENSEGFYMLTEVSTNMIALVAIDGGVTFAVPYCVSDVYDITPQEFSAITALYEDFKYVDRVKIEKV